LLFLAPWCLGGSDSIALADRHVLVLHPGSLAAHDAASGRETARLPLEDAWFGLAIHPKGDRVFVAGGAQPLVHEVHLRDGRLAPARRFPVPKAGFVSDVALSPDGRFLYALRPFDNALTVMNALTGFVVSEVATGRRPYSIVFSHDGKTFWVSHLADGAIGQYNAADGARLAVIPVGPHPTGMALLPGPNDPGESGPRYTGRLFVACANTNSVVVLGLTEGNALQMIGRVTVAPSEFAPLGSTPTALALSLDGRRLYVAVSNNDSVAVVDIEDYTAELAGFLPAIPHPTALGVARDGRLWIAGGAGVTVRAAPRDEDLQPPPGLPAPKDWASPPIQQVVYVLTEGPLPDGPNTRRLGAEFARLDQFQPLGRSAVPGYQWSTAAIVNHFVEKLVVEKMGAAQLLVDLFQTADAAVFPPAGYLWTNALAAGLSVRNWGLVRGRDPALARLEISEADFTTMARTGALPHLLLIRLAGPDADTRLGRVAALLSQSPAWPRAALFVVPEFSADASRPSPALIVSPYARRGFADQNRYNTLSVLRTIELLLGLQPMTQFDAAAAPASAAFTSVADPRPFAASAP